MVATLWLLSLSTITLITTSECVYAPPPLVKYRRLDNTQFGIQDGFLPEKRSHSLSIVNPLDVLRQRLLLEIARRQMRENTRQVELNRAILKNVGKRGNIEVQQQQPHERQSSLEREQFEPFQQHPDLNSILNVFAEAASHANDRSIFGYQSPDYFFDDGNNAIDNKHMPIRHPTIHLQPSRYGSEPFFDDDNESTNLDEDKQRRLHTLRKQQLQNGPKTHNVHQWGAQSSQQTEQKQPHQQEQQQQQQQSTKAFDNNENFMMPSPFATI